MKALLGILAALAMLMALAPSAADAQVTAVRVWPAPDSTRVTFESPRPVTWRLFLVRDPDRVVLELDGIDIGPALAKIGATVPANDPLIRQARVGRYKPGVIRVVFDVKAEVAPQAFALKPIGEFGHRIVLDLFPVDARDPVAAFLERQRAAALPEGHPGAAAGATVGATAGGTPSATASAPSPAPEAVGAGPAAAAGSKPAAGGAPGAFASQGPDPSARAARLPPGARPVVIAIDPGHGGEDPGAIGPTGLREKDVVLAISRRLARLVDAQPGMRAHLVRTGDYFVPLHMRVVKARALKADLFVSIHADAWMQPTARGSSVYALSLSGATSAAARWLASRENEADLVGGVNLNVSDPVLKQTLLDLSQTATINDSLRLGRTVLSELGRINRLHRKQVEQAGFAVLKAPDIPSILVETAFISNPEEEQRLADENQQERIAQSILDGIRRYIAQTPGMTRPR
ncbi:MAG: N-acetylmuramoyl-L-alanine amidase [bacterium]|jgi:N-acetylmuramoyl-L-alanine amidase